MRFIELTTKKVDNVTSDGFIELVNFDDVSRINPWSKGGIYVVFKNKESRVYKEDYEIIKSIIQRIQ